MSHTVLMLAYFDLEYKYYIVKFIICFEVYIVFTCYKFREEMPCTVYLCISFLKYRYFASKSIIYLLHSVD